MLHFDDVGLRRGPKLLFEHLSCQIHPGQKVGVTGANGTGKSSLFALVQSELDPDTGNFSMPADWVTAHVAQEAPHGTRSALEFTLDGDAELRSIEAQLAEAEAAGDGERQAHLHGHFEVIGGYSAQSRAGQLLHGLGFSNAELDKPVEEFSGGWRVRLNLARALMCRADLLLLDEPTNHLDLDAVLWLEKWLNDFTGTLLLVSHDRDFLDGVSTHILSIERKRAELFPGNYSAFERIRAERLAGQQAAYKKQQREIAHMRAFVERFRAKATKARQAQSRLKALGRMETIAPAHVDSPFRFALRKSDTLPAPLLKIREVACGYGDNVILRGIDLSLAPGDRIGLLGPNGAGKSTLIKLLAGELPKLEGELTPAKTLAIGYFAQHQVDQLEPGSTPIEHLASIDPDASEKDLRNYIGGYGFSGDKALEPVRTFSGGEKSRLALALLIYRKPNLLLLDEPTNHLDLEMRQALANALQDFAGAMVIVSHDRHLLRLTVDRLLLVTDGAVDEFDGSLEDYPKWMSDREKNKSNGAGKAAGTGVAAGSAQARKEKKRREAERRQALAPLRKQLESSEKELERLNAI
ncbi:MAG: ATP-binding cassette domain-containing protein, partial [Gammaproteobacteria bacterium]|nr:ATP-binding cassette domain-containing protein [Gammaproteobacteria bacterium]